jgi:hypothetical protein
MNPRVWVEGDHVSFSVGVQSFRIAYDGKPKELQWMRRMVKKALDNIAVEQKDINALYRLMNYIEIEGDVGDKVAEDYTMIKSELFRKLIRPARLALRRLEKKP